MFNAALKNRPLHYTIRFQHMFRVWSACNNEKYANMKRTSEVERKKCLFENDQYGTHTEMLPSTILAFKSASYVWALSELG